MPGAPTNLAGCPPPPPPHPTLPPPLPPPPSPGDPLEDDFRGLGFYPFVEVCRQRTRTDMWVNVAAEMVRAGSSSELPHGMPVSTEMLSAALRELAAARSELAQLRGPAGGEHSGGDTA